MSDAVRVRFAPSPTGMLHVGGARSALFNWALARQAHGRFVLRIEDTDVARNRPEWAEGIITALAAIGISRDDPVFEGPYFQSHSVGVHREASLRLFAAGKAYYCGCTREDLARRTGSQQRGYDGYCRDRGLPYAPGRALRFRTPDTGRTVVDDVIRGRTEFPNNVIEDFVIARGDGTPVFVLANVVDDAGEGITHVLRGEEHLSNTPKQQLLWAAFGAEPPVWAHLPVIVNEQRQKLSKRRDKVALEDYLAEGYLPSALVNYLMLLGWGPRDGIEMRPYEELEALFRLEEVSKASAFFDVKKLAAFNGWYIRALTVDEFIGACQRWLAPPYAPWAPEQFDASVLQGRRRDGADPADGAQRDHQVRGLALPGPASGRHGLLGQGHEAWRGEAILASVRKSWADADWRAEALRSGLEAAAAEHGLNLGKAQAPVRVAVTGRTVGLPLFESVELLGRERTLTRIDAAAAKLAVAGPGPT